jgi:short-chain fatty acids transporter
MNLVAIALTLVLLPALFWRLGKRGVDKPFVLPQQGSATSGAAILPGEAAESTAVPASQAHWLDHARWAAWVLAGLLLAASIMRLSQQDSFWSLRWLTLNWINGFLFGMGLLMHGSFSRFVAAVDEAMPGAAGIAVQFPLYFGIMGVMNDSGLIALLADGFVRVSSPQTFPLLGMLSAGIVNVFVPSGGGQWQVQGPILLDAARQLGVADWKAVMALAYGDQLTNMLQPFWALPLLGITGLQAREILPYTLIALLAGLGIFAAVLLLF